MHGILLSHLGWCLKLLLGIARQATKWIGRTVGPSLAASLEPLAHCQNVTSLSLLYSHYFGRCPSELVQLIPLPFSQGRSTRYSDRLHDIFFLSPFLDVTRMSVSTVSFLAQLDSQNSLPRECIALSFDLKLPVTSLELPDTYWLWVLSKEISLRCIYIICICTYDLHDFIL